MYMKLRRITMNDLLTRIKEMEAEIARLRSIAESNSDAFDLNESHIGLIVEAWDSGDDEIIAVGFLAGVKSDDHKHRYVVNDEKWECARLYSGKTVVNWRLHDGSSEMPDGVCGNDMILLRYGDDIAMLHAIASSITWSKVVHYSAIYNRSPIL